MLEVWSIDIFVDISHTSHYFNLLQYQQHGLSLKKRNERDSPQPASGSKHSICNFPLSFDRRDAITMTLVEVLACQVKLETSEIQVLFHELLTSCRRWRTMIMPLLSPFSLPMHFYLNSVLPTHTVIQINSWIKLSPDKFP